MCGCKIHRRGYRIMKKSRKVIMVIQLHSYTPYCSRLRSVQQNYIAQLRKCIQRVRFCRTVTEWEILHCIRIYRKLVVLLVLRAVMYACLLTVLLLCGLLFISLVSGRIHKTKCCYITTSDSLLTFTCRYFWPAKFKTT